MAREIRISLATPMLIFAAITEMANHAGNDPSPSLEVASKWFDRASIALAISLLAGFAATVVIIWLGIVKEHHWDLARERAGEQIGELFKSGEELKKEAEQLRKDTAEANDRAAQARLELQRLSAPRMIDPQKFNSKLAGIKPPASVEILYVPECSDCFIVASMIGALLKDRQWPFSISELKKLQSPPDWMAGFPATIQHRANPTGVSVLSKTGGNLEEKTPANALMFAIGSSISGGNGFAAPDTMLPDDVVRVVVAPKL